MNNEKQRLAKLQRRLQHRKYDVFLFDDSVSLYYLTGLHFSAGQLLVYPDGAQLIVDGRYYEGARSGSFYPVVLAKEQALEAVLTSKEFRGIERLGYSEESSHKGFLDLKRRLSKLVRPIKLVSAPNPLAEQRLIKDASELDRLRKAGILGTKGFEYACSVLREGITERQVASKLEVFWQERAGSKVAFEPIIAFEPNSSQPHYRPRDIPLSKGQSVLFDIGVTVEDYHSDMTRVVFFGPPNPKILEIYAIVRQAQEAALALCKPGTNVGKLDAAARQIIEKAGYGEAYPHSLGHGIGLDVHELPRLRDKAPDNKQCLQSHMAITIEPGIYLPGIGGVRIEDTVVITEDGHEDLTRVSKDPLIV